MNINFVGLFCSRDVKDTIKLLEACIELNLRSMLKYNESVPKNKIANAQYMLYQTILLRTNTLLSIVKDIRLKKSTVIDVASLHLITRANYEAAIVLCGFGKSATKNELETLRYLLWELQGKKGQLQSTEITPKLEIDIKNEIDTNIKQIKALKLYSQNSATIDYCIKSKKYLVSLIKGEIIPRNWTEMESKEMRGAMSMLQYHAHPSSIAVFNFQYGYVGSKQFEDAYVILKFSVNFIAASYAVMSQLWNQEIDVNYTRFCNELMATTNFYEVINPLSETVE